MARVALISLYDEFCIGLRHLGGFLKQKGHEVTLIHFKRYESKPLDIGADPTKSLYITGITPLGETLLGYSFPYSEKETELLLNLLAERRADIVGISVASPYKGTAVALTKLIKANLGLPIVWGGVHPTVATAECFEADCPLDAACVGEGEIAFHEFLQAVERKSDFRTTPIAGMWIRCGSEIARNPPRRVADDLDALGFQFHDEDAEYMVHEDQAVRKDNLPDFNLDYCYRLITMRGCPCNCSFCIYGTLKKRFPDMRRIRRRTPGHVIEEILLAKRRMPKLTGVEFYDDIFAPPRPWLLQFAEMYRREVHLPFWFYTYPTAVNRETLRIFKEMGSTVIIMGIQSGSERINYDIYNRRTSKRQIIEATRLIADSEIYGVYDVLSNNPYETEEDLYETLDVVTQIPGPHKVQMGKVAFFAHTPLAEKVRTDQIVPRIDEETYRFWNALYLLPQYGIADRQTILSFTKNRFLRKNPQVLWDILRQAEFIRQEQRKEERTHGELKGLKEKVQALEARLASLRPRRAARLSLVMSNLMNKMKRLLALSRQNR